MTKKKNKLAVPSVPTTKKEVQPVNNKQQTTVKEQPKKVEQPSTPVPEPQPISIKSYGKKTIGQPKSGKFWKKESERSNLNKKPCPLSWTKKMEAKAKLKRIRERIRVDRELKRQEYKEKQQKLREKIKRRELNEFKSSQYQVIKDTRKVKKWNKKAKNLISKMPAEIFYEKYK